MFDQWQISCGPAMTAHGSLDRVNKKSHSGQYPHLGAVVQLQQNMVHWTLNTKLNTMSLLESLLYM
jgi:hypothetical protein